MKEVLGVVVVMHAPFDGPQCNVHTKSVLD